jgi:hypothetical protein
MAEPVNVYEVTGLGLLPTRLQPAVGRGLTKFVGRQREMEVLKHALEQAPVMVTSSQLWRRRVSANCACSRSSMRSRNRA